ncbi:hypothetical protein NPX13_g9317 [Xylaria arbuscula]|uniref:Uncharacterized protein n=1 Tax=Xylaria arbuscula TaxID=114810 RepID=A0A9W8TJ63_9PEZI|nr:hypothetical protein NPX13_g9317 [Xylaria arbuscula]
MLILYLNEQNAGLLIRHDESEDEAWVIFESFEASASSSHVLAAGHAMQWDFPGRSARILLESFTDESFLESLASFLEQASIESLYSLQASSQKAGVSVEPKKGQIAYKLLLAILLAELLNNSAENLSLYKVAYLRTKLACQMAKLEINQRKVWLYKDVAYNAWFTAISAVIRNSIQNANMKMEAAWDTFKKINSRHIIPLLYRAPPTLLELTLPNSGDYLDGVLSTKLSHASTLGPVTLPNPLDQSIQQSQEFTDYAFHLAALKEKVKSEASRPANPRQNYTARCVELESQIEDILSQMKRAFKTIGPTYDSSPEQNSATILAIFTLWVELDRSAIAKCQLLGNHAPVFHPKLLDALQLPTKPAIERLQKIQKHLANQHAKSIHSNILETHAQDSVTLRYSAHSRDLQSLEHCILDDYANARQRKRQEHEDLCNKKIQATKDSSEAQRYATYGLYAALLCQRTFAAFLGSQNHISSDDLSTWIQVSIAIQENMLHDLSRLPDTIQDLLFRDAKMVYHLQNNGFLPEPHGRWIVATTPGRFMERLHFNYIKGHLLVNRRPRSKLPRSIANDDTVMSIFGVQHLITYLSNQPGISHRLAHANRGLQIHFGLRDKRAVIRAVKCTRSSNSKKDLGICSSIETSKRENDWFIDIPRQRAYRGEGRSQLVDPHSETFAQIASIFADFKQADRLTVFQPQNLASRLTIKLKHLDLHFIVNQNRLLYCQQLNAKIDTDQDARTWYGLHSKIVMREVNTQSRSIIVPLGKLIVRPNGFYVECDRYLQLIEEIREKSNNLEAFTTGSEFELKEISYLFCRGRSQREIYDPLLDAETSQGIDEAVYSPRDRIRLFAFYSKADMNVIHSLAAICLVGKIRKLDLPQYQHFADFKSRKKPSGQALWFDAKSRNATQFEEAYKEEGVCLAKHIHQYWPILATDITTEMLNLAVYRLQNSQPYFLVDIGSMLNKIRPEWERRYANLELSNYICRVDDVLSSLCHVHDITTPMPWVTREPDFVEAWKTLSYQSIVRNWSAKRRPILEVVKSSLVNILEEYQENAARQQPIPDALPKLSKRDLSQSLAALKIRTQQIKQDNLAVVPQFRVVKEALRQAHAHVEHVWAAIATASTAGDNRACWLELGAMKPLSTAVDLLKLLRSTESIAFRSDSNIIIRDKQVNVAKAMIDPTLGNGVLQLSMGKGKTLCIIPMVVAVLANGQSLSRVIVPKALNVIYPRTAYTTKLRTLTGQ